MRISATEKINELDARQFAHRYGISHPLACHLYQGKTVTVPEDVSQKIIKAGMAVDTKTAKLPDKTKSKGSEVGHGIR